MLLYCNRSNIRTLLQRNGSIIFQAGPLAAGLFLAIVCFVIQLLINLKHPLAPELPHHYGMHALGVVVSFAVVFRANLGWQRYWESVGQLHFMYSKWADAFSQFYAFSKVTVKQTRDKGGAGAEAKIKVVEKNLEQVEAGFFLLSALVADRLTKGDTQRMEKRAEGRAPWSKRVVMRHDLRGDDITGATKLPEFKLAKPGATQNLDYGWHSAYVVKRIPSEAQMRALEDSTDRANMAMYWLIHTYAKAQKDIDIAPPIQSRMYQEMSNGMLGFNNAVKIADVPFPFPYAQLLTIILVAFSCFAPIYIACFTQSLIAGPLLTFLLFLGLWGVNEVAIELENPFGGDANDICLADFHARFVDVLGEISAGNSVVTELYDVGDGDEDDTPVPGKRSQDYPRPGEVKKPDQSSSVAIDPKPVAVEESSAIAQQAASLSEKPEKSDSLMGISMKPMDFTVPESLPMTKVEGPSDAKLDAAMAKADLLADPKLISENVMQAAPPIPSTSPASELDVQRGSSTAGLPDKQRKTRAKKHTLEARVSRSDSNVGGQGSEISGGKNDRVECPQNIGRHIADCSCGLTQFSQLCSNRRRSPKDQDRFDPIADKV